MEQNDTLFAGLQALADATFPKKCSVCGKSYESAVQFMKETQGLNQKSGLKSSRDDNDKSIVEMFRNCACGSTLMSTFADRRDTSTAGLRRRELFGQLLTMLTSKGVNPQLARAELLKFINGRHSPLLEKMGLKAKTS
ncbi:MAG: hypothetical protein M0036_24375 [Desulfobacteraceae bacterium]|nr:hypothetical protein [Desulfobacteraceae bacterium]